MTTDTQAGWQPRPAGIGHAASGSIRATAMAVLMMLTAVACAAPGPVPLNVARRLPAGVFYLLVGPNDTSTNLWQVTNTGCERQLTHNRRGYGVSDFGATRA